MSNVSMTTHCLDSHITATSVTAPTLDFPSSKRPFVRRCHIPIAPPSNGQATVLYWPSDAPKDTPCLLRISSVVDERAPHHVAVSNARTGKQFGIMDVLFACPGQVFELALTASQATDAIADGLSLQLTEEASPLWISVAKGNGVPAPTPLQPHLLFKQTPADMETFLQLFCTTVSLAPCDWMEACVLDGLRDWAQLGRKDAKQALQQHLDAFFRDDGQFIHENIRGEPNDNQVGGAENTGPFAVLAMEHPTHQAIPRVEAAWEKRYQPEQDIVHDGHVVGETSYSVAYPMMALALHTNREKWYERSLKQLIVNRDYLAQQDDLWLRHNPTTSERTFRNWSRGVAWYFVGLTRTLALLPATDRPAPLVEEVQRVTEWVAKHQQENGLWPCFIKELEILPDTSGSAGIGAAVAIAAKHNMVDTKWLSVADRAMHGLSTQLAPDGFLRGVAQSNKRETHEMDIQRHHFRVIGPWGAGLFAQLAAARQA